ncbi:hypothetical protein EBU99_13975 [bacterium]|nr:hypothetical protein [bacterium]
MKSRLTKVIFKDGTTVDPREAARMIGLEEKSGDDLMGMFNDNPNFKSYIYWSIVSKTFFLSGLSASWYMVPVKRINSMKFELAD